MRQVIATPSQFGRVIASRRKSAKLSQAKLAGRLGISQNRYSELEEDPDKLTLERAFALASFLGLEFVLQDKPAPTQRADPRPAETAAKPRSDSKPEW